MRKLKLLMTDKSITSVYLANQLGVTRQTVSNYRSGVSKPDYETFLKMAEILEVEPKELQDD